MSSTGALTFQVHIVKRDDVSPLMMSRLNDFTPFFNVAIKNWANHNVDKFRAGAGAEEQGVSFAPEPTWDALTPEYHRAKARAEYADNIMVRTGELGTVLTNDELFFKMVSPMDAVFGTPMDPEDMIKVSGNWERRQVIFLDEQDMSSIKKSFRDYIDLGPGFEDKMVDATRANWEQNAEFSAVIDGSGGSL